MSKQPPLRGDAEFRDEVVRLAALTVNSSTIEGYRFLNCRVIGPAILALLDRVTITHCRWDAPGMEAIFWEVPPERQVVIGAVGVIDCTFSNCAFENVGIAGPIDLRTELEKGFS